MHPDDSKRVEAEIADALRTGAEFASEYRLLQRDQTIRWVYAVGRCSFGEDGQPLRFPGITVDITERKAIEDALRESEARFNAIYSNSHEYIGILHVDGTIVDFNRAALEFAGNTPHEIRGLSFAEGPWFRHTPGARELVQQAVRRAAAGELVRTELPLIRPTGETLVFDFSLSPVRDEAGEVIFLIPEARDITDVKQVDEALRTSEARLRVAAETAHLGIWQLDLASYRLECSDLCKMNYGRSPDDPFPYEEVLASVYPEDRASMQKDLHDAIVSRRPFRSEYRILWPDESLHWILASGRVLGDEDGEPVHMVGVSLDLTDRRLAEAALLQSEKLAAVGRLAASIAHEINNPLESVTNLLYLARSDNDPAVIQQYLDMAERELRRVSVISSQTLRFHKQSTRPKAVTFEDLIESVLSIHHGRVLNSRVEVLQRTRATKRISCFDGEIRQVLNNLVGNAVDAMHPNGGRLLIRSRHATAWSTGRQGLMITIADTGTGMSAATQKKIFNPFFTTKGLSGNGLGLWVSKEIVERHHGTLHIRSSQRQGRSGTVFTFFLPFEAAVR
jgi:PAS domain S-box-containing protein